MMTAAPIDIEHELLRPFQRLLLAIPIDLKRYVIMCRFLAIVLNLDDTVLDELGVVNHHELVAKLPVELLPNIAFPPDIWLRDDICIKDVKVKLTMLNEINLWLEQELGGTATDVNEELTLLYYEKLLQAYNFYDMPSRRLLVMLLYSVELVLREEEHENDADSVATDPTPPVSTPPSKPSKPSLQKSLASTIHTTNSSKRVLALSREIINLRKRFLTLLGHQGLAPAPPVALPPPVPEAVVAAAAAGDDDRLNSLLSKTKIYSKLKKNRELALLLGSTALGGYLNRNLVATTASASLHGLRRRLLVLLSFDDHRLVATNLVYLLVDQKRENRKQKLEYYLQLMKLYLITETILKTLSETKDPKMSNTKLVRFLEFIKKKVFRFVLVDISLMIMDYGVVKTANSLHPTI